MVAVNEEAPDSPTDRILLCFNEGSGGSPFFEEFGSFISPTPADTNTVEGREELMEPANKHYAYIYIFHESKIR